ncbi:MAG: hypothetical protein U9O87_02165 [Verrucomicrobiota bacterium]|nr:hypothetical protein [Verrucomicrobiota bacterium]
MTLIYIGILSAVLGNILAIYLILSRQKNDKTIKNEISNFTKQHLENFNRELGRNSKIAIESSKATLLMELKELNENIKTIKSNQQYLYENLNKQRGIFEKQNEEINRVYAILRRKNKGKK